MVDRIKVFTSLRLVPQEGKPKQFNQPDEFISLINSPSKPILLSESGAKVRSFPF